MSDPENWRYERKFLVPELACEEVEHWVRRHAALFTRAYPPRWVNNIYLDTDDLRHYHDHVQGISRRVKVRVRWYGDLLGPVARPVLEFKLKQGLVGRKVSYPLPAFRFDGCLSREELARLLRGDSLPAEVSVKTEALGPTLLNRYHRRYYRSADCCFRLTHDSELGFGALLAAGGSVLNPHGQDLGSILELKYESRHAEAAEPVMNGFPFRVRRISKYIAGMEACGC